MSLIGQVLSPSQIAMTNSRTYRPREWPCCCPAQTSPGLLWVLKGLAHPERPSIHETEAGFSALKCQSLFVGRPLVVKDTTPSGWRRADHLWRR